MNIHATDQGPEIHTVRSLVPETSFMEVEIATEKLKYFISLGIDLIPSELLQGGSRTKLQGNLYLE